MIIEMHVMYGYKYVNPCFPQLVEEKPKAIKNNRLYLLELFVGKAAIEGFKSTFSLYNKAI